MTKFEFMNPHALIYVDVTGNKGEIEHWIAEESSNNHLSRSGWDKNTLKVGTRSPLPAIAPETARVCWSFNARNVR